MALDLASWSHRFIYAYWAFKVKAKGLSHSCHVFESHSASDRLISSQIEMARKQQADLEKASTQAAAKAKDLDAQRATLIRTHAKDRQTWQTQLRTAQAAEREARADATAAKARALDLEGRLKGRNADGRSADKLPCRYHVGSPIHHHIKMLPPVVTAEERVQTYGPWQPLARPVLRTTRLRMTGSKPKVVASQIGTGSGQQTSSNNGAAGAGSNAAASKVQTGSAKTTANDAASVKTAGSSGAARTSEAAMDGSAATRDASSSVTKGSATAGATSKVKTRADGQLTQGAVVGTDLTANGKAASGDEAATGQSLAKAAVAQEDGKATAAGAHQKGIDKEEEPGDTDESTG